jgi:hypothetical protein
MAVSGAIITAKRNPGLQDDVTYTVHTGEERVSIDRFSAPDRRLRFTPDRLALETASGAIELTTKPCPEAPFCGRIEPS